MTVAVLALQGAFIEHCNKVEALGERCIELRCKSDLERPFDRLILPGGESTTQAKLLHELDMADTLRQRITDGMPTLATCAGAILLARKVDGAGDLKNLDTHAASRRIQVMGFATMPITVKRNAYGRQLGSFRTEGRFGDWDDIPMTFIRAPFITELDDECQIMAQIDGRIVAARYRNQLACAFHPELDQDDRIHSLFLGM